jgi:hypothetical protein
MLRPNPFFWGLLLVFAAPVALEQSDAVAATKQRLRKANADDQNSSPRSRASSKRTTASSNKKSGATAKASSKRKPAEVKLKAAAPPAETTATNATASAAGSAPPSRGPTRIDFDDRLIQGQSNKSGAVYLYDRKELKTPSMIKKRESFREEILATVYAN